MTARTAALSMLEDRGPHSLDARVRALADELGLWCFRVYRASERGWPDLFIAGRGRHIWRELKSERGVLSSEQRVVGERITAAGGDWSVWRPRDLLSGRIARQLTDLAAVQEALFTLEPR
jgi:hypothetical protein